MLTKNTLDFLADLDQCNNRDWFQQNRKRYDTAREDFTALTECVLTEVSKLENLGATQPKDCVFRINRDVRFSKDKRPYKSHFSMAIGPGGRHSGRIDYYLQIQPGNQSFLGAGMWSPTASQLAAYRQEVDYNAAELRKIIENDAFMAYFPEKEGAVLKTTPKGFAKDHPEIDLLRRKELFFLHRYTDRDVLRPTFVTELMIGIQRLKPYCDFLNYIFHDEKEEANG